VRGIGRYFSPQCSAPTFCDSLLDMFSSRLAWDARPNPLSLLLDRKRAAGAEVLDLTESNPTRAGIAYPADAIVAALADPRSLDYHPAPAGLRAAREAVSAYYGGQVEPSRIILTASTSEAYGYLFKLLANPGDEVLVPRPSYPLFDYLAALENVCVRHYRLAYDGAWRIDFESLLAEASERTRAVVLVNPNNPTGSFLKRDECARLSRFCAERGLALICDEVFADYAFDEDPDRVRSLVDDQESLAFSLSGLSKVAGLPQLKLGWIVASGPDGPRIRAIENLELIADTYLSVGTPVQWAAAKLLAVRNEIQTSILTRVRSNREFLAGSIGRESPFRVLPAEGGWYAVIQAPRIRSEEQWALDLLENDGVLVQPGFFFDFESEAFLVGSLLTREAVFREGIRRLLAYS
jgi:aspartate/methionine/tyrosine aminotransferase